MTSGVRACRSPKHVDLAYLRTATFVPYVPVDLFLTLPTGG